MSGILQGLLFYNYFKLKSLSSVMLPRRAESTKLHFLKQRVSNATCVARPDDIIPHVTR